MSETEMIDDGGAHTKPLLDKDRTPEEQMLNYVCQYCKKQEYGYFRAGKNGRFVCSECSKKADEGND